jgi:serine/threonine protein kinase
MLGQYVVLEELGRGGFGCVYKAAHILMDRIVALKVIAPDRVEDEQARDMFLREVRATTRLHHPNIALAYNADEVDGQLFLAMEFVEGPTLEQLVRVHGPLSLHLAWGMIQQTAQALRYAHELGMIHRDIKPANLIIPQAALTNGRPSHDTHALVKVVDFGLARLQAQAGSATLFPGRDKAFAGTPDYMSPEQARNLHDVDARSDLYSLGCTFYYALAGREPFDGKTALEIVLKHFEKDPEPLETLRPDLPPALAGLIRRLMEKQPERRFQSCDELLAEMSFLATDGSRPAIVLPSSPNFVLPPVVRSSPQVCLPLTVQSSPDVSIPPEPPLRNSGSLRRPILAVPKRLAATVALPDLDRLSPTETSRTGVDGPSSVVLPDTHQETTPICSPAATAQTAAIGTPQTHGDAQSVNPARPGPALCHAWGRWSTIVAAVSQGAKATVGSAEYQVLHGELLRELRAYAAGNDATREPCCRLESLVEPWLSMRALVATDAPALHDLARRTDALAGELGLKTGTARVPMWPVVAALLLLVIGLSGIASLQLGTGRLSWHMPSPHSAWLFVQANPILSLTLLLPGTVLAGFYALTRVLRT